MVKKGFKKGDRVEYTWSNDLIGKPPFTGQGTITHAHRDGSVSIAWDHAHHNGYWWPNPSILTKLTPGYSTRGGKREGAGRKSKDFPDTKTGRLTVSLPLDVLATLKANGTVWLADLIRAASGGVGSFSLSAHNFINQGRRDLDDSWGFGLIPFPSPVRLLTPNYDHAVVALR